MSVEFIVRELDSVDRHVASRKWSLGRELWESSGLRRTVMLLFIFLIWELYARHLDNPLLFPSFLQTLDAFWANMVNGVLPARIMKSLSVLLTGYLVGTGLAFALTMIAISTRIGTDFLQTATAMLNPLPAIALLPLSLIWFGLGDASLVFVLVHSVLWVVALNTLSGFRGVSPTLRMVGRNYELSPMVFVSRVLFPAAFPSILTGLKIGWAFAWRTLIAAELVFGASSGAGGLGWFIFESRNTLEIASVFAGLLTVILIGLAVESLVFRVIERNTIEKWGAHSS